MSQHDPLSLQVQRVFAREPAIAVVKLGPEPEPDGLCVEADVLVNGRAWTLHVHPNVDSLFVWLGGSLLPIGPIVDEHRTLTERLTPVRMFADVALQAGTAVIFDELDHVVPRRHIIAAAVDGFVVDGLANDGTVGVLRTPGVRW